MIIIFWVLHGLGQFYYERCLPMGASSSCQIFEQLLNRWKAGGMFHIWMISFSLGFPTPINAKMT
jgi:hypothetical protein